MAGKVLTFEVDFNYEGNDTPSEAVRRYLEEETMLADCGVTARIVKEVGPAGGAPVVQLTGDEEVLFPAMIAFCGGDEEDARYLVYGEE